MLENDVERVSVIIPTRNRHTHLTLCLSSLLNQNFKDWNLVIANDGDEDLEEVHLLRGIFNLLELKGHRWKIIATSHSGQGGALNVAHRVAEADLILRIDDDAYLEPDYIELLFRSLDDEKIGAVGGNTPNVYHSKGKLTQLSKEFREWGGKIVFKGSYFVPYERQSLLPEPDEQPYEVDQLRGHFLYRKKVLDEIGGFPLVYSQMGRREDTDTSLRMKMAGYRLLVVPQAIAWHIHSPFGGTRDGIDSSNYKRYLQMEEDDLRLFEDRMWGWIREGLKEKVKIVIPDEFEKLRRLRYRLKRLTTRGSDFKTSLEIINLKRECLIPLNDQEVLYLLLSKVLTLKERDEIVGGDRL
ncbi:TPA: hypothetical protein DCX15_00915 [bacterium]|nr:hypothetical protein [bacterium]